MYENISDKGLSEYELLVKYEHKHLNKDMFDLMRDTELIKSLSLVEDFFKSIPKNEIQPYEEQMIEPINTIIEKLYLSLGRWKSYQELIKIKHYQSPSKDWVEMIENINEVN